MNDRITAITAIAEYVDDTLTQRGVVQEDKIIALAIMAARTICEIGDAKGGRSQDDAILLLEQAMSSAIRNDYRPPRAHSAGHC